MHLPTAQLLLRSVFAQAVSAACIHHCKHNTQFGVDYVSVVYLSCCEEVSLRQRCPSSSRAQVLRPICADNLLQNHQQGSNA
ncbi:hypothetical protein COO60DRAFT_1504104 [Scenedesmus sp. NREL 46B-D3]|nr:hypothetical protein COO60DRAFT_1504104 [Scenedesmus sp. NREL 46B-D3]